MRVIATLAGPMMLAALAAPAPALAQSGHCIAQGSTMRCALTVPGAGERRVNPVLQVAATNAGTDARGQVDLWLSECGRPGSLRASVEIQGRQNQAQRVTLPGGPFAFTAQANLCVEVFVSRCTYRGRHAIDCATLVPPGSTVVP